MIVDASAVVAILLEEPDGASFAAAILRPVDKRMSAVNAFEAALRLDNHEGRTRFDLEAFLEQAQVQVEPATLVHIRLALEAHRSFGKGRHPARLNLGDCFAYALAIERDEPLLYKGGDFARTDVRAAL